MGAGGKGLLWVPCHVWTPPKLCLCSFENPVFVTPFSGMKLLRPILQRVNLVLTWEDRIQTPLGLTSLPPWCLDWGPAEHFS